jgi:arginase
MKETLKLYEKNLVTKEVSLISFPTELGSDARGLKEAPRFLYEHGLLEMLRAIGAEVAEEITIPCETPDPFATAPLKNLPQAALASSIAAQTVAHACKRDHLPIVLGGDHSISIGTIRGASTAYPSLGLLWIDAHPDVHTHESTLSGNLHGMGAALAMGFGSELLVAKRRAIKPEHVLFLGVKDFDPAELEFLREQPVNVLTMMDFIGRGLSPAFTAIDALRRKVGRIWVSMDIDSIDRTVAPGVAMPNTGGFTYREITSLAHYIGKTCEVAGLDIVELLPKNDKNGQTAALTLELIAKFLGGEYGSYQKYMARYGAAATAEVRS